MKMGHLLGYLDLTARERDREKYAETHLGAFARQAQDRIRRERDDESQLLWHRRYAELFDGHPSIVIPSIEAGESRVVITSRLAGADLKAFLGASPGAAARHQAALALFELYLGTFLKRGWYSLDPRPAEDLFLPDGRVAFVEFDALREFDPLTADRLSNLTHAVRTDDGAEMHQALTDLGVVDGDQPYDRESVRWLFRAFYGPMVRDEETSFEESSANTVQELVHRRAAVRGLAAPDELVFLLRTFRGLAHALALLGARANWYRLLETALQARPRRKAPEPVAKAPEPPPPKGASAYDVLIADPGSSLIEVVRLVRDATGLDLKQVKELVESRETAVKQALPPAEAEALRLKLEAAGARVELRAVD